MVERGRDFLAVVAREPMSDLLEGPVWVRSVEQKGLAVRVAIRVRLSVLKGLAVRVQSAVLLVKFANLFDQKRLFKTGETILTLAGFPHQKAPACRDDT